jgi:hypothetical protein
LLGQGGEAFPLLQDPGRDRDQKTVTPLEALRRPRLRERPSEMKTAAGGSLQPMPQSEWRRRKADEAA